MKKGSKNLRSKEGSADSNTPNSYSSSNNKIMSSNLPLLFANGRPRSLETISQVELEEFVPFMILCSLGEDLSKKPTSFRKCRVPEWWPEGFPFKFPHIGKSEMTDRLVILKSLVCRCYTFYKCEFLLKFSSELAEMPPSHLQYQENKEEKTTSILDATGKMLVKCRNENIYYDAHKNQRRYLSPSHRTTLSQAKKFGHVIDLTFDTSSEDEKEVYFKESSVQLNKAKKRKGSDKPDEQVAKRRYRRLFNDFPVEDPEPSQVSQELFMRKHNLIPKETVVKMEMPSIEDKKKRWTSCFTFLSITSERGQKILERRKHTLNVEACLDRISQYCTESVPVDDLPNQVCTRASVLPPSLPQEGVIVNKKHKEKDKNEWCHQYKWPCRTRNPRYPHRGPSLKECSVVLRQLSQEEIYNYFNNKRSTCTMTPRDWWDDKIPICPCQKIPVITLEDEEFTGLYSDKSISTRCSCVPHKQQAKQVIQPRNDYLESKNVHYRQSHFLSSSEGPSVKYPRTSPQSISLLRNEEYIISGSSASQAFYDKGGLGVLTRNGLHDSEPSLKLKKTLYRRPLSVVAPTLPYQATVNIVTLDSSPPPIKVNYHRSILDAIKWYTKDDLLADPLKTSFKKSMIVGVDQSQENIKPLSKLTFTDVEEYLKKSETDPNRDYCYERSSGCLTKLVTRRGERHYIGREPCPSCFQGNDRFCVYEFVRRAKLADVTLLKNQRLLRIMYYKIMKSVNKNS